VLTAKRCRRLLHFIICRKEQVVLITVETLARKRASSLLEQHCKLSINKKRHES